MTNETLAKATELKAEITEMEAAIAEYNRNIMYISTNKVGSKPMVVSDELKAIILGHLLDNLDILKGEFDML